MTQRHFDKDEFPRRCDHCPAPLVAGTRYRKVLTVLDAADSFVGGEPGTIENSFELVFCHRCYERLSSWLLNPLSEIPPEGEPPAELDEAELEEELEKELFILGDGGEPTADSRQQTASDSEGGCVLHPKGDDPICYECYRHRLGLGVKHESSCHCPECAPCRHHPGVDCGCLCRFGTCGTGTCPPPKASDLLAVRIALDPELFRSVSDSFQAEEGECSPMPKPCLDPDKMHGASDQFGGSDYDEEKLL